MIPEKLAVILRKYHSRGIILDSNLLVLLIVGSADPNWISEARPTRNRAFSKADFALLREMLARVKNIVTTPHLLAETSNLLDQIKGGQRDGVIALFAEQIRNLREWFIPGVDVAPLNCFAQLGVTDCAIMQLAKNKYLTVTVDAPLYVELVRRKQGVINFEHYRPSLQ